MILYVLEIIIAVLLVGVILLQSQGSGLSGAFGGSGEFYRSKRSIEKLLVWATAALTVIFGVISIVLLLPR
ncbi:preprotein translocase subunit SecG [Patescibacteria group bacterium]|nr:preprotein translocase subunit SecG [Patescibacteria group bacterium]